MSKAKGKTQLITPQYNVAPDDPFMEHYKQYRKPYLRGPSPKEHLSYPQVYKKWVDTTQKIMVNFEDIEIACK
jgi:hypothetical protein